MTKQEVIVKLQELAKKLGTDTLRQEDIKKAGFLYQVQMHFGGKLKPALTAAGLKPSRLGEAMSTSKEELLQHIHNLQKKLGRPPTIIDLRREGKFSDKIYETRFGSFPEARAIALGIRRKKEKILGEGANNISDNFQLEKLHSVIYKKCKSLFINKEYSEAVEKGFKIVRDRLRELTGYETGSEAFGKGNLHIKGAAARHVDIDFNEGVKFLTMAIDRFRNEKSHTADGNIDNPLRAYQYLVLCSLAMNLLDNSEIKTRT